MAYNFSELTEYLHKTATYDVFTSAYRNLRFNVLMDKYITVDAKYEANLPGLAFDTYGDTELWRAILYANGLHDPLNDIVVGCRIGLPEAASLYAYLLRTVNRIKAVVI